MVRKLYFERYFTDVTLLHRSPDFSGQRSSPLVHLEKSHRLRHLQMLLFHLKVNSYWKKSDHHSQVIPPNRFALSSVSPSPTSISSSVSSPGSSAVVGRIVGSILHYFLPELSSGLGHSQPFCENTFRSRTVIRGFLVYCKCQQQPVSCLRS